MGKNGQLILQMKQLKATEVMWFALSWCLEQGCLIKAGAKRWDSRSPWGAVGWRWKPRNQPLRGPQEDISNEAAVPTEIYMLSGETEAQSVCCYELGVHAFQGAGEEFSWPPCSHGISSLAKAGRGWSMVKGTLTPVTESMRNKQKYIQFQNWGSHTRV